MPLPRSLLIVAALALAAAASAGAQAPERVSLPASLEILLGPLTPASRDGGSRYDEVLLAKGREYAEGFPVSAQDLLSSNYYDLALVLYAAHYRTGDPYWLAQARRVARAWRDSPNNQGLERGLSGENPLGPTAPPPRGMATLGLAVLAVEAKDGKAARTVDAHARLVRRLMGAPGNYGVAGKVMPLGDAREAGYALMALVAATVLDHDHRAPARQLVDAILARQLPSGRWESWAEAMGERTFTLNYMNGLLMEALVLYDRAVGDARIVPALRRATAWTWRTQWRPEAKAFQYGNVDAGTIDTLPAPVLNGLMLPAWGHLSAVTGDPIFREQGAQIMAGLIERGTPEILGVKQFAQVYRSSGRFLGFEAPAAASARRAR